jgi:hypothetical protein
MVWSAMTRLFKNKAIRKGGFFYAQKKAESGLCFFR